MMAKAIRRRKATLARRLSVSVADLDPNQAFSLSLHSRKKAANGALVAAPLNCRA